MQLHQRHARGQTCLIVEDSEFDQQRMTRIVSRSHKDMEVRVATTIRAAREILERGGVSLILLDNNLPDGFGADFSIELAADEELSKIPVVMVSDWPSPFMWEKAASAGVLFVIGKADFGARYVREALRVSPPQQRLN